jgi:hypothetical protein
MYGCRLSMRHLRSAGMALPVSGGLVVTPAHGVAKPIVAVTSARFRFPRRPQ